MSSPAPADRHHGDHRQRSTDATGLPGSGRSRASSEEPGPSPLSSLQKEINLLRQTTQTLRELAHTQKATTHRVSDARDPFQRLAPRYNGPPAQLDLTGSQPGGPADGGRPLIAEALTRSEEAVLRRLTTTLSLAEISRERNVSRGTIKAQVRSIYRKLGVASRHEAIQRARELGLLTRRQRLHPGSGEGLLSVPAR